MITTILRRTWEKEAPKFWDSIKNVPMKHLTQIAKDNKFGNAMAKAITIALKEATPKLPFNQVEVMVSRPRYNFDHTVYTVCVLTRTTNIQQFLYQVVESPASPITIVPLHQSQGIFG